MELNLGNFFFQILAFALLFIILKKYAFGPLVDVMEKRQKQIEDQINSAEANRKEAERLLEEQNEALQKSRLEAQDIIERAKVSSEKQAEEIIETAKAEATRIKEQAVMEIQLEKEKAVAALREQVGTLSVLIASKMIEKELDVKEQSKLIDDVMKQVGESL
ncbi:ATP synthase F0 subunit B [Vulcanibacillus modesticaldus]|uniref:ATP synthase subunit b n=1 Tax=Vulcanibacillus modesticaldus TaxID=337097 RepID=A0A1D2YVV9_9BACI|nr:F0F1 ATP synthase subunit B [Vulcanibacillus modesticaldus]OEF99832.1 ATP synthase F0 subunit B [Vulcanibacillus modesticaldus]